MKYVKFESFMGYAGIEEEQTMLVDLEDCTPAKLDALALEIAQEFAAGWEGDDRLMSEEEWQDGGTEAFYDSVYGTWEILENE